MAKTYASQYDVPRSDLKTISMRDTIPIIEFLDPDFEPPTNIEAKEGHMIVTPTETTEKMLVSLGFALKASDPLQ